MSDQNGQPNPPRVDRRRDIWMDGYWKALNENLPIQDTTKEKHDWWRTAYERHQHSSEPGVERK